MGSGGPRGLQILPPGANPVRGGFDSHTFPPSAGRRGPIVAALLLLLLLAAAGAAAAEEEEDGPGAEPFVNALRSLAFPGWGQLHAGNRWKAVALFAGQTYLLSRVVITERRARWYDEQRSTPGSPWGDDYLRERYEDLRQTRSDLVWWSAIAALFSALDAYVDAHLVGFDESVEEVNRVTWTISPARGGGARIGIRAAY